MLDAPGWPLSPAAKTRPLAPATQLELSGTGRLLLPAAGLDLVAVGLTTDEAMGCAALLTQAGQVDGPRIPAHQGVEGDQGWRAWTDQAGALRAEHTRPRTDENQGQVPEPARSLWAGCTALAGLGGPYLPQTA